MLYLGLTHVSYGALNWTNAAEFEEFSSDDEKFASLQITCNVPNWVPMCQGPRKSGTGFRYEMSLVTSCHVA
jgi:hypothetical protein